MPPRSLALLALAVVLIAVAGGATATVLMSNRQSTPVAQDANGLTSYGSSASAAPNFLLHDQFGRPISLSSLRGKAVALTFISTACREDCPLIGSALAKVDSTLSAADRQRVVYVGISVAPTDGSLPSYVAGDTLSATAHFISSTGLSTAARARRFLFLTGQHATLAPIWQAYHVAVDIPPRPKPGTNAYTDVGHTALIYLVGPDGTLRDIGSFPFDPAGVAADLHNILG